MQEKQRLRSMALSSSPESPVLAETNSGKELFALARAE